LAVARLQGHQLGAEKGHGKVPMNVGAEVLDYIKITDSAAGDLRVGNIGYITRHYAPGVFEMEFGFGALELLGLAGTMPPRQATVVASPDRQQALVDVVEDLIEQFNSLLNDYNALRVGLLSVIDTANSTIQYLLAQQVTSEIFKLHVTGRLQIPQGTDKFT
ncbi:hypothetical protein LCGC14_1160710, partial [marine sediment metagenome]